MTEKIVVQVIGYKNRGKTTTTCELISRFSRHGLKVGSVKHDAHRFELDHEGKDTWRHREAGALVVAISSPDQTAVMERRSTSLEQLIERIQGVDLIIVEGYKFASYPKVVILREEADIQLIGETSEIIAISSWFPFAHPEIPVFDKDDYEGLFLTILSHVRYRLGLEGKNE